MRLVILVEDDESASVHEVQGNEHIQISFKKVKNKEIKWSEMLRNIRMKSVHHIVGEWRHKVFWFCRKVVSEEWIYRSQHRGTVGY